MKYNINETQISSADAKEVFKTAADLKNKPSGLGKVFKGLRKEKIDVNDLQQAWKDEGFPDDTADLSAILQDHGFDEKEIKKVFKQVFNIAGDTKDDDYEAPAGSEVIKKLADYAKKFGIVDELKAFMEREFGEEMGLRQPKKKGWFKEKAVVEEIRQIFTSIVHEERTARTRLIKQQEQTQLGRTKK